MQDVDGPRHIQPFAEPAGARWALVGPVAEVMSLAIAHATAREAAAPVPMGERASQSGGNRAGPGPDLDHAALLVMAHHHPAGVAGQALGRFCRNAHAVLEDRLPRLLRIGQHGASTWTTTW